MTGTVKEIKATLSNGFTFVLDFASSESEVEKLRNEWNNYYESIGVMDANVFVENCESLDQFSRFNYWAIQLFGDTFSNLPCKQKISASEMAWELSH